tara:strand:+ start:421 stop:567 length:147 start_codon:yes stop_codon:yes gene_type:complete
LEFIGLKEKKQKKTYFEENLNKLKKVKYAIIGDYCHISSKLILLEIVK